MNRSPLDPLLLFRSFLTVVSGFIFAQAVYFGIAFALGYLFFPEFLAFFRLDPDQQQQLAAENIQAALPWQMFVALLLLSAVAFWLVGWLSAALAPFSHFQHGLFIAILVFIWFLQSFVADPPSKKIMNAVQMLFLPIPLLLGARRASEGLMVERDETDE